MSFILDALKKIERDKRRGDGAPAESMALSRSRFGARPPVLAMAGIAVGSALVTALAVSYLSGRQPSGETSPPGGEVSLGATTDTTPETAPSRAALEPTEAVAPPPRTRVREARARANDTGSAPPPVGEPEPPVSDEELAPAEAPAIVETGQPIRIVGRERALLDGLSIDDAPEPDDGRVDVEPESDDPLPEGFPELVLQGTSMIGADAVAVISDQRVFEGDRIEGALVVRIGEREVELELDGRRFTLRL